MASCVMSGSLSLKRASPSCVAWIGLSARSSCHTWSKSLSSGPLADFGSFAAKAGARTSRPSGTRRKTNLRRIGRAFSATRAGSGKGLGAYVPHRGTKAQKLNVIDVRVTRNQLHVGVVQESRQETLNPVESLTCARQGLHLAHHLRLPVLCAWLDLAQFF